LYYAFTLARNVVGRVFTDICDAISKRFFLAVALESEITYVRKRGRKSDDQTAKPITTAQNILELKEKGIFYFASIYHAVSAAVQRSESDSEQTRETKGSNGGERERETHV